MYVTTAVAARVPASWDVPQAAAVPRATDREPGQSGGSAGRVRHAAAGKTRRPDESPFFRVLVQALARTA